MLERRTALELNLLNQYCKCGFGIPTLDKADIVVYGPRFLTGNGSFVPRMVAVQLYRISIIRREPMYTMVRNRGLMKGQLHPELSRV